MLLALVALGGAAFGQGSILQDVVSGKDAPLSLHLKDLNSDWKRMSIATPGSGGGMGDMLGQLMQNLMMGNGNKGGSDAAMGMAFMSSLFGGMGGGGGSQPVYYTKGQTGSIGGETFLIAYRYEKPEVNFMQLIMESEQNGGKEPDFAKMAATGKMSPESAVTLSLLNVKSISAMSGIRSFDMNQEIAESQKGGGGLLEMLAAKKNAPPPPPDVAAPVEAPFLTAPAAPAAPAASTGKPKPKPAPKTQPKGSGR